jgi:7-cyano-7-deazaguanine synthase
MTGSKALVLFSGGQDSTTCLAWALENFSEVETVGFAYGQRHAVELDARPVILQLMKDKFPAWSKRLGPDRVLSLDLLAEIGGTALTENVAIEMGKNGLPTSFVPARNILFLSAAAALGMRRGISDFVGGMCETDYSGYPDCRSETIVSLEKTLTLGLAEPVKIHTPLMHIDKASTWRLAASLGGAPLIELIIEEAVTCYIGEKSKRHDWGYGCGLCPACKLRATGYAHYRGMAA